MVEKGELRSKDEKVRWRAGERPQMGMGWHDDHGGVRDGAPNPTKTSYIPRNGQFATARLRVIWWFFFPSPSTLLSLFSSTCHGKDRRAYEKEDNIKLFRAMVPLNYERTNERTSEWDEMRLRGFGHNTTPMYLRDDYIRAMK